METITSGSTTLEYKTISDRIEVNGKMMRLAKPLTFPVLKVNGQVVMSKTPQEEMAMTKDAKKAKGIALVGGLGLGIILDNIRRKCSHITVVEKNKDVVEIYKKYKKCDVAYDDIVVGEVEDYLEKNDQKYDYIHLDTWYSGDYEQLPHVNWMMEMANSRLAPKGVLRAWVYDTMRKSFAKDCAGMRAMAVRGEFRNADDKIAVVRDSYPMLGAFISWIKRNPEATTLECDEKIGEIASKVKRLARPLEVEMATREVRAICNGIPVGVR
jgi:hypothetical protein